MIDNMPDVRDINVLLQAMQEIGADVDRTGKHEVTISGKGIHPECDVDNEFIYFIVFPLSSIFYRPFHEGEFYSDSLILYHNGHTVKA